MKKILILSLLITSVAFAESADALIENNGCFSCHSVASKKLAPAFAGIARRNKMQNGANAKEVIMKSIREGSQGKYRKFADTQMPPYPDFSDQELSTIADYILSKSSLAKGQGGGMGKGGMQ